MVEPGFLHAALTARRLLVFFALGAGLLGAKHAWIEPLADAELPLLEVHVARDAGQPEIKRASERAFLAAYAIEHGALEADPVVQRRLREDLGLALDSSTALAQAGRTLQIERADPMLRERLAWHGEQLLRARVLVPQPDQQTLQRYLDTHASRYRVAERFSITHILIANRRGQGQAQRVAEVQAEIARGLPLTQAEAWSDASILPRTLEHATAAELDATFGPGFGEALALAAQGAFSGPIASRYGVHFVWLRAHSTAQNAALEQVRAHVLADYLVDARRDATARAVQQLAARYRVALIREGA